MRINDYAIINITRIKESRKNCFDNRFPVAETAYGRKDKLFLLMKRGE